MECGKELPSPKQRFNPMPSTPVPSLLFRWFWHHGDSSMRLHTDISSIESESAYEKQRGGGERRLFRTKPLIQSADDKVQAYDIDLTNNQQTHPDVSEGQATESTDFNVALMIEPP
jgi:hypothetical protein